MTAHPHSAAARDRRAAEADAMGIDEVFIDRMVEVFYSKVREDSMLGALFADRIDDWPAHLGRMKRFWGAVLRGDGGFSGNPMLKHIAIPGIERDAFLHWLSLFEQSLAETAPDPHAAALVHARARSIADSLLTGIRLHRDHRTDLGAMKGLDHG